MRALALFSGGLDSMIAMKLITMQNIEVIALNMNIGFGGTKDLSELFRQRAKSAGAEFEVVDVRERYINKVLFSPRYGYGKRFNPCIDCHAFMFSTAKELMAKYDANFIITGEVLGQRPMSQNRSSLDKVLKLSNDEDSLILRPLSAKLLEITKPELKGWVEREKLLDIQGRDRKRQLELAKEFGFEEYQNPGGGCLLTEEFFTKKLREFISFAPLKVSDIDILKVGRHFRLPNGSKLILGRNEEENRTLENIKNSEYLPLYVDDELPAPYARLSSDANAEDMALGIDILLAFTKGNVGEKYKIKLGNDEILKGLNINKDEAKRYSI